MSALVHNFASVKLHFLIHILPLLLRGAELEVGCATALSLARYKLLDSIHKGTNAETRHVERLRN